MKACNKHLLQRVIMLLCIILPVMAAYSLETDYFKALEQIKKPPLGSTPILPCDIHEKKQALNLMRKSGIQDFGHLKLTDDGNLYDQWNEDIEIYKGDFSNEGALEYAVISTGGTLHANTIIVYKLVAHHLINTHLDQTIINNLIPGQDLGIGFYLHVADPFAIMMNHKTYLRFMDYPSGNTNYDKTQLRLCTYLWQGTQFALAQPNWRFTRTTDHMVSATDCVGSH